MEKVKLESVKKCSKEKSNTKILKYRNGNACIELTVNRKLTYEQMVRFIQDYCQFVFVHMEGDDQRVEYYPYNKDLASIYCVFKYFANIEPGDNIEELYYFSNNRELFDAIVECAGFAYVHNMLHNAEVEVEHRYDEYMKKDASNEFFSKLNKLIDTVLLASDIHDLNDLFDNIKNTDDILNNSEDHSKTTDPNTNK